MWVTLRIFLGIQRRFLLIFILLFTLKTGPEGYEGQFCQACSFNYRHEPRSGGAFSKCVKCECNGHADYCDAETGKCQCEFVILNLNLSQNL